MSSGAIAIVGTIVVPNAVFPVLDFIFLDNEYRFII
jgi:hypothetical protein